MSNANLAIIISAIDHASKELKQIRTEVGGLDDAAKTTNRSGLQALKDGFSKVQGAALKAYAAFKITKEAVDKVYQAAREGADLVYLEQRFDNLSRSIGTTSSALLMDLRSAVKGTKSDMELMAGASDMLALGLAKSHEQAVRLTAVAGALGWNMDQLTLTITNETTKRLDTLGLSVESVKGRYEALKEAGIDGQQAMTQAVIEAGEAMITLQGHIGDTTLGAFTRMEAAQTNFFGLMKMELTQGMTGWAEFWTNVYDSASHAVRRRNVIDSIGSLIPELNEKIESAVEKNLETADKSFSELYGMYASGTGSIGFAVADSLAIKKSWDELLDLPGAEAAMIGVLNQFERLSEGSRRYLSKKIDWERYLNNEYYRATVDEMIDKSLEYDESIKTTGKHYDDYEDKQKAVAVQYEEHRKAREEAILQHVQMQETMRALAGTTDEVSVSMTQWLNTQKGFETFLSVAKVYTVEMRNISENKAKIAELNEIIKNDGGVFEGAEISAEKAAQQVERLNGEIEKSEQRMKNMVKEAVLGEMTKQIIEGTGTWGEKLELVMGMYEATGDISREAAQETLMDFEGLIAYLERVTGKKYVIGMEVNMPDTKTIDDWQPPTKYIDVVMRQVPMSMRAAGGTVQAAAAGRSTSPRGNYLWQEYGYPGEMFVPSMDGYILSKADAAKAVSAGQQGNDLSGLGPILKAAFLGALDEYASRPQAQGSGYHRPLASAFENINSW